jgi:hypothetical protein
VYRGRGWAWGSVTVLVLLAAGAAGLSIGTAPGPRPAPVARAETVDPGPPIGGTKRYDSIDGLLADTKLLVVATARSLSPASPASNSTRPWRVAMTVDQTIRGPVRSRIEVTELGGPGPIAVGQTYLMCLGFDAGTDTFYVLNGITGLFTYDPTTQAAAPFDTQAAWIPSSFTLSEVRSVVSALAHQGRGEEPTPTSPTTTTTSTTEPPPPGACPPGCSLPASYDAVTVMASSSGLVAIVTAHNAGTSGGVASADLTTDQVLQDNANDNVYPPPASDFGITLSGSTTVVDGDTYVVFMSFNRGGSCLSALFSYDANSHIATFVSKSDDAEPDEITLPGRELPVPETISLAALQARMYPTGGVVYPSDTAEWYCPGP